MNIHHQSEDNPIGHVTSPIVTGGAVIALKCKEGIIIATDTLLSYGGLLSTSLLIKSTPMLTDMSKFQTMSLSLQLENSQIFKKQHAN